MYPATANGDCTVVILTFIPVSNFVCRSDEAIDNDIKLLLSNARSVTREEINSSRIYPWKSQLDIQTL